MRLRITTIAIAIGLCTLTSAAAKLELTYVANAGFMVEAGKKKILIDALFDDETITYCQVPDAATRELTEGAQPPFDDVDLILATHNHRDHFSSAAVLRRLAAEPSSVFAGPPQAVAELRAAAPESLSLDGRVHEIALEMYETAELELAGVKIHAMRLHHSSYMVEDRATGKEVDRHAEVENLAYLIELRGKSVLHVGDAVLAENEEFFASYSCPKSKLDVVFLEYFDTTAATLKILYTSLNPAHVVFVHLPREPEQIAEAKKVLPRFVPQAVVFARPLESVNF